MTERSDRPPTTFAKPSHQSASPRRGWYAFGLSNSSTHPSESRYVTAAKTDTLYAAIGSTPHLDKQYASFVGIVSGARDTEIASTLPWERRYASSVDFETSPECMSAQELEYSYDCTEVTDWFLWICWLCL